VRVFELAVEIFPVLSVSDLDVHGETLGDEVQLVAKTFQQYAAVALNLFDPFIYFIELAVYPLESPVDLLEPLIMSVQPLFNAVKSLIDSIKSLIKVLNEFLIHAASAVMLNSRPFCLSCQ
jgi:hypothetical protein